MGDLMYPTMDGGCYMNFFVWVGSRAKGDVFFPFVEHPGFPNLGHSWVRVVLCPFRTHQTVTLITICKFIWYLGSR